MNAAVAAAARARDFLAFIGVMAVLGSNWSIWERVGVVLAGCVIVVIAGTADGHRLWPHRIPRPTRYSKAA